MNRRTAVFGLLTSTFALSGCSLVRGLFTSRRQPPAAPAHYFLGDPYQMGGVWYYPAARIEYTATGLAAVADTPPGLTADGERFDQTALAASHHTLQLPAIAQVTNLENGRSVLLRLNDRGPANPGRLIGLTEHAATLLGAADGTQIRVDLDPALTQALTDQVGGGPKLAVAAAPLAQVQAEDLPPPPGAQQATGIRSAPDAGLGTARSDDTVTAAAAVPDRLPDQVTQGSPEPGLIMLQASEFGRAGYANRLAAQLSGMNARVERLRDGRTERYRVVAGPFASAADADDALDQALRAGVIDSRLVVIQE